MPTDYPTTADGERRAPTVDVLAHLKNLLRALPLALVVGVLVAGGVFAFTSKPADYQATVVAQIVRSTPTATPTDVNGVAAIVGPYLELGRDTNVMRAVAVEAGVGSTPAELAKNITVAATQTAGILNVTAVAADGDTAQRMATASVKAIDAAYQKTQGVVQAPQNSVTQAMADLQNAVGSARPANGDGTTNFVQSKVDTLKAAIASAGVNGVNKQYLVLLSSPTGGVAKASSSSTMMAAVAGLAGLIIAAELIVLARSPLAKRVNPVWAQRISRRTGAKLRFGSTDSGAVPLDCEMELTEASRHGVVLALSMNPDHIPSGVPAAWYELDGHWWDEFEFSDIVLAVVVLAEGERTTGTAEAALTRLAGAGIPAQLVVVRDGSRLLGWHLHLRRPNHDEGKSYSVPEDASTIAARANDVAPVKRTGTSGSGQRDSDRGQSASAESDGEADDEESDYVRTKSE